MLWLYMLSVSRVASLAFGAKLSRREPALFPAFTRSKREFVLLLRSGRSSKNLLRPTIVSILWIISAMIKRY